MADFGAWSLLPPALAITAAIVTRRVYQSLFLGVLVAAVMVAGAAAFTEQAGLPAVLATATGSFLTAIGWLVDAIADRDNAGVIAFTLFLGALIALLQRSGAVRGFGEAALRYASTRRRGQAIAWLVGATLLAIDDYFHVIAAGAMFRPVTDRLKVSREKLAYIIDSTAAPMVILVPISTWVGVILSIIIAVPGLERNAFQVFLEGIPFNFYAILAVAFVGVVALTRVEYGPMRTAERRAEEQGLLLREGAKPLMSRELAEMEPLPGVKARAWNLVLPVAFLFVATFLLLYATGRGDAEASGFFAALQHSDPILSLAVASFLTLLFAMALYGIQGAVRQDDFLDTSLEGFKAMVPAVAILVLAWAIGIAVGADGVGLGDWVAGALGEGLALSWIPFLAFLIAGLVAFSTGTSFGTFAIMLPITLGIAVAQPDSAPWLGPIVAATVGGAVFGDHCSPISDTTVLSSMAGHCDHIDHVRTQLPYALTVAGVAAAGYAVLGLTQSPALAWLVNLALFAGVFALAWSLGRRAPRRAP